MDFLVLWPTLSVTVALGTLGTYILFVVGWQVHDDRDNDRLTHASDGPNRSTTEAGSPNRDRVLRAGSGGMFGIRPVFLCGTRRFGPDDWSSSLGAAAGGFSGDRPV